MTNRDNREEDKFGSAVTQAPVAICVFRGRNHIIEVANTKMLELWGTSKEQTLNKPIFEAVPEAAGQGFEQILNEVYITGQRYSTTEVPVNLPRNGTLTTVFVNLIFEPLLDEGLITGITAVATDVTELVRAKHALLEKENQFRNLVLQSPIAMAIFKGKDYLIDLANESMLKNLWRKNLAEVLGEKLLDVFPEIKNQKYAQLLDNVFETGISFKEAESIAYVDSHDGRKTFYFDYEYAPLFDVTGSVSGIMITVNDVTEKVEARQKISDAAERLYLVTEGTQLAIWDLDLVTEEIIHSPRLAVIFGHSSSTVMTHRQMREQIHAEDLVPIVEKSFELALKEGFYQYEARLVRPDATIGWIKIQGKVVFDKQTPLRMLGTAMDVTGQRAVEENMAKLADIVKYSDDAIISKRLDGTVVSWNDSARRIFGYTAEEMIGQPISRLIPPDRLNEEPQIIRQLGNGERVEHYVTKRLTKDKKQIDISLTISPIKDQQGKVVGASKIARDITLQKEAERQIKENEERLKIVLDASDLGTWELDLQTKKVIYSQRYLEMFGFENKTQPQYDELIKRLHPDDLALREKSFQNAFLSGHLNHEIRVIWDDGSIHWLETKGKVFYDTESKPSKLIGTCRDITNDVLYKQRIEESEKRFRTVADTAPVMIWMTNLSKESVFLNKCWSDFTGISIQQGLGRGWVSVVHPDDAQVTSDAFEAAYQSKSTYSSELRIRRKDGKYRWVQDHAVPRYDAEGTFLGYIGTSVDVHEQRDAKTELENKVKERTADLLEVNDQLIKTNEELEQFAYISSHDLQEPLRKIQTFSELLSTNLQVDEKSASYLEKINTSALRMSNLIKDLLNYSHLSKLDERFLSTNLNEVFQNIKNDFEVLILQKNAEIISTDLPVIRAIPIQINQLFYNLISNSLKFSEATPRIHLSALPVSEGEQKKIPELSSHFKYVHLVFKDNGIGFSPAHAQQIFVIFQRLNDKQKYSGTGIGLAICKKIVENHLGFIAATSEIGAGATFDVYLPI